MGVIDIGSVLNKFDDTVDEFNQAVKEYQIRFITGDGRLRTMRCRKNVRNPHQQLRAPLARKSKTMFNLQRHGTLLVNDLDLDRPRTVKVATICQFKDFQQTDWNRVRH
jgi:hypothetical protein